MSLSISLHPISRVLDMYGTAHTSCSYSLSGSVHLKLSKTPSLFPSGILRRSGTTATTTTNVVLSSLVVTFEGKSEHQQEGGSYSAARLCTVSQQLITSPITLQLNNDNESSHASHYDIIFDLLTIPGWLPATFTGTDSTYNAISSTSYSLFATATYHIETLSSPVSSSSSSLTSTFCNLMQTCNPLSGWLSHADKKSHADRVDIEIVRHLVSPPSTRHANNTSLFPPTTFSISAQAKESSPIPNDVVSRLSIVASIPGFVSTTEKSIPISLKARFKDNDQADDKLAIERVEIDIDQNDTFYAKPDDQYTSRFALPSEQPPTHPLLHRSVSDHLEHLGFIANENRPKKWVRTKSVLDPTAPSSFYLDAQDAGETPAAEGEEKPYTLGADWSIIKMEAALRKGGDAIPATHLSPFLRVTHTLNIALYIKYGNDKKDVVQFPLPINFVVLPPATTTTTTPSVTPVQTITTTTSRSYEPLYLPAYTQLFHEDGEARVDLSRGVPPAYRDKVENGEGQDGVVETFGRTVKKPELVPVGTTEVDWNSVQRLLD